MMKSPLDRGGLRFYLVLVVLIKGSATYWSILGGMPFLLAGVAIHFWAKGCLRQNRVVAMGGPYRFVRHPFYLGNAFIDAAIGVMSGWWVLQLALPIWWLAIYIPAMRREEAHVKSLFPDVYGPYQARVPQLVPCRRPLPRGGEEFSWQNHNIAAGMEIPRALRLLAYPLLFYVAGEARAEGWGFASAHGGLNLWALVALALLYGLSWETERHVKHRARILPALFQNPRWRLLIGTGILTVAVFADWFAQDGHVLPLVGAAILGVSGWLFLRRKAYLLLAECLALMSVAVGCELPWLTIAPILLYGALMMDSRLAKGQEIGARAGEERVAGMRWYPVYHVFAAVAILAAVLEEMF